MNDKVIASETFDSQLRRTLVALLDTMIPANEEFNVPSAGIDDIVNDVVQSMSHDAPQIVGEMLVRLNEQSSARFEDLDEAARWDLVFGIATNRGACAPYTQWRITTVLLPKRSGARVVRNGSQITIPLLEMRLSKAIGLYSIPSERENRSTARYNHRQLVTRCL